MFEHKDKVQKEVKAALKENAMLSCEVAQEKTDVKWYKEGKLITSSKKFKVESEGKSRRLVVGQVEKKDAGEYTCEAGGQKLTFKVDITGEIYLVQISVEDNEVIPVIIITQPLSYNSLGFVAPCRVHLIFLYLIAWTSRNGSIWL